MLIRTMTTLECTKLLDGNRLCRIACAKDDQPYVVPAYFAHADNHLFMFSMPGKKIEFMRANPRVSVLVWEHANTGSGRASLSMADMKNCLTR